jgi:hypothetical protein
MTWTTKPAYRRRQSNRKQQQPNYYEIFVGMASIGNVFLGAVESTELGIDAPQD